MTEELIAKREFIIEACQERLWHIIGGVILNSLPGLERMEVLDDSNWRALLRVRLGFVVLNMNLKGEMIDILPPEALCVRLMAKSKGRILQLNQKISITFTPIDEAKTEVVCKAMVERMGTIFRLFLLGRARIFAQSVFCSIEMRLRYLT